MIIYYWLVLLSTSVSYRWWVESFKCLTELLTFVALFFCIWWWLLHIEVVVIRSLHTEKCQVFQTLSPPNSSCACGPEFEVEILIKIDNGQPYSELFFCPYFKILYPESVCPAVSVFLELSCRTNSTALEVLWHSTLRDWWASHACQWEYANMEVIDKQSLDQHWEHGLIMWIATRAIMNDPNKTSLHISWNS